MWLLTEIFENGVKIQMNAKIVHQEPIHVFIRWGTQNTMKWSQKVAKGMKRRHLLHRKASVTSTAFQTYISTQLRLKDSREKKAQIKQVTKNSECFLQMIKVLLGHCFSRDRRFGPLALLLTNIQPYSVFHSGNTLVQCPF